MNTMSNHLAGVSLMICTITSVAAAHDEPTHEIALLAIQSGLERLAPTIQQAEWTFVVDDCTNISCAIRFPQAGLTTSITGPQGQIITPQTIANFDGSYDLIEGPEIGEIPENSGLLIMDLSQPGFNSRYKFPTLGPGTYTARANIAGLTTDTPVIFEVTLDSDIVCNLVIPQEDGSAEVGRPVVLAVPLLNGAQPVAGATVTATVVRPDGTTSDVTLVDDGQGVDLDDADGVYSGEYTVLHEGEHTVGATCTGTVNGVAFTRHVGAGFTAHSGGFRFVRGQFDQTPVIQSSMEDLDSDGLDDKSGDHGERLH